MAEKGKSKSQRTQTESAQSTFFSLWLDPAYLEYMEYVWPALLVLVFLAVMWTKSRRTWMLMDALATVVGGLVMLFAPEKLFGLMMINQVKTDIFMIAVCRMFASASLGAGLAWFCLRKSTDNYTQNMLLGTRIVATSALVIAAHVAKSQGGLFNDQAVRIVSLEAALWMLGSFYFFLSAKNYGGHTQLESWLNLHLRFDFFLTLMLGLILYAFPEYVMKMHVTGVKPTIVHNLMGQMVGSMMIGSSILSAVAPGFMFHEDKRNVLLCRILTLIFLVVTALSSLDHSKIDKEVMLGHLLGVFWIINAALGYFAPHETDGYWHGRKNTKKE